ncbi:MAG: hypothetical protein U9R01_00370 [candidate division WOR-3 bacterium]|nr:hypothetical protein [candidate division WOR-3 bacterium]
MGYAWKDSLGWHTTHPYPGPWIDGTSLKLDKHDYPHIGYAVYIDDYTSLVMYSYWDGNNWHTEVIDTMGRCYPRTVTLILDSNERPHLAYGRSDEPLRHAEYINGTWHIEVVDSSGCICPFLAIDKSGHLCIAYMGKYAVKEDTNWHIETIEPYRGGRNSLYFDRENNPHISYEGQGWLKYAWKCNGVWHIEKIDSIIPRGVLK